MNWMKSHYILSINHIAYMNPIHLNMLHCIEKEHVSAQTEQYNKITKIKSRNCTSIDSLMQYTPCQLIKMCSYHLSTMNQAILLKLNASWSILCADGTANTKSYMLC